MASRSEDFYKAILTKKPDLRELLKYATTTEWYTLGLALKLKHEKLDEIQVDHPNSVQRRLTEVFKLWLRGNTKCTRRHIIGALEDVQENLLAKKYKMYLKLPEDAVFPNNKSTCTLQQELKHTACAVEATDYQNQQDTMNQVMDQEEQMNQETDIEMEEIFLAAAHKCTNKLLETGKLVDEIATLDIAEISKKPLKICEAQLLTGYVKDLVHEANRFINKVDQIVILFKCSITKVETQDNLKSFINESKNALSDCEQLYRKFMDKAKETQRNASKAAVECDAMAEKASRNKFATKVVGAGATVALLSITAAGVVMIFTSGLGTPVMVATASAGTAGCAGAATATLYIANQYSDAAKTFRRLENQFNCLHKATSHLVDGIYDVVEKFDVTVCNMKLVPKHEKQHHLNKLEEVCSTLLQAQKEVQYVKKEVNYMYTSDAVK